MIGLTLPCSALILFGILFNPFFTQHLPKSGWMEVLVSPQIFFLISSIAILFFKKLKWKDIGISKEHLAKYIGLGLAIALIPAILTLGSALILTLLNQHLPLLDRPLFGGEPISFQLELPRMMILFVLAPISEELFFRGIFLKSLREHYSAKMSVILTSIVFMAGHGSFAPGPLMLGFIIGPVRLITQSIVPGVIYHSISNMYGPILMKWFPNLYRTLQFLF